MSSDKSFRTRTESLDAPGPHYFCGKCGRHGVRLWRETNVTLEHVDLRCEACATSEQTKQIAACAHFHHPSHLTIGYLVPARPTAEGDTFWGHTSGDVDWWLGLPSEPQR